MAPSPYIWTEDRIQRRQAAIGESIHGKAWLQAYDVPSIGRTARPWSILSDAIHHVLSDGEYRLFLTFEHNPSTTNLVTQPALPRWETYRAAEDLGYCHPTTVDGTPNVMTADLRVDQALAGNAVTRFITYKHRLDDLTDRDWEKLEIARLACERLGTPLEFYEDADIDRSLTAKWDEIRAFYHVDDLADFSKPLTNAIASELGSAIGAGLNATLVDFCAPTARKLGVPRLTVFQTIEHPIARRVLSTDLRGNRVLTAYRLGELLVR